MEYLDCWKYGQHMWQRAWNGGTRLQTFVYMHEFWSRSEAHGKLIATCRPDFRNKYLNATRALVGGVLRLLEISTTCLAESPELWD